MSILRKDPVSSGWVIIAEDRAERPFTFETQKEEPQNGFCPFCEGNESYTPPEIVAYRKPETFPNKPGWTVRTIPNKFAALRIEGDLDRRGDGIYDMMQGIGAHEVIIESPEHNKNLALFPKEKVSEIIRMYRDRDADLIKDKRFKYIQIFRNYGAIAGASIHHPLSQLIALPITPRWVKEELICALEYYQIKERCLFCDIVNQEIKEGSRVVIENKDFLSFTPFASKFPFETWIIPKRHQPYFRMIQEYEIESLGEILKSTLFAIHRALSDPPYNFIIHAAPVLSPTRPSAGSILDDYHWHIEIIPRVTKMAGFEWGTGFYINSIVPEHAAEYLREVLSEPGF